MHHTDTTQPTRAARAIADDCLCFRARRLSRVLTRMYDEALRTLPIQATQLTVLSAVALGDEASAGAGAPMSRLATVLAMDPTTLSRTVRPLERSGHVAVTPSPEDGRVRLLRLTAEGEALLERALPLWEEAHERVVELLGPELAAELRSGLDAAVADATGG